MTRSDKLTPQEDGDRFTKLIKQFGTASIGYCDTAGEAQKCQNNRYEVSVMRLSVIYKDRADSALKWLLDEASEFHMGV